MMRLTLVPLLVAAACALLPPLASADGPAPTPVVQPKLESLYLTVSGATTGELVKSVFRKVTAVRGVKSFVWTAPRTEAKIVRVVGQADTASLVAACRQAGVRAQQLVVTSKQLFFQQQLHCNGCVIKVKRAMKGLKGMKEVSVARDKLSVRVLYDAKKVTMKQLRDALASVGYPAKPER